MLMRAIPMLLFPSLLMAQDAPLELLKKVAANYRALIKTTYDFERVEVREDASNRTERRERILGSGGRYRYTANGRVYLIDGQYGWTLDSDRNEYTKVEARLGPILAPSLYELQNLDTSVKSARFLREESLETVSGSVMCQIIEVERVSKDSPAPYSAITYWIDSSRNLVLKSRHSYTTKDVNGQSSPPTTLTVSFPKADIGPAVDEQLFRFTPPENSVQVEQLGFGTKSALLGKTSPDFEWKGVDGRVISLRR